MANEKTPVVWDDTAKKHRPLGSGEKMGGLSASSMISSDSGNLLQQGSDGLMLVTGGSLADPRADNLLEESANGRLQVTSDRVVEWLESHPQAAAALAEAVKVVSGDSGNVIVAGTDKGAFMSKSTLASAVSTMSAAQLSTLANALRKQGGGLSVGADGKLSVDFASMDPAIMRAVVLSMVQQGGGIGVDQNGQLYVDFDSMPTDKFESMLKSLKMLVPIDRTMLLYVDTNSSAAGDTIIDGRGTQAKPFKTIQACVNYVTSTYAIGNYGVYINVGAGTYNENVSLPDFSRGRGAIWIRSASGARDVVVVSQLDNLGTRGTTFSASGGHWHLQHIECRRVENPTSAKSQAIGCFYAGNGALLRLHGVAVRQSFIDPSAALSGEGYSIRVFYADAGGKIYIEHDVLAGSISVQANTPADHGVSVFAIQRGGELWLTRAYDEDRTPVTTGEYAVSGSCDRFLECSGGMVYTVSSGNVISFVASNEFTGKRYVVNGGGSVAGNLGATYFPGDVEGTVDSSTYSWYA